MSIRQIRHRAQRLAGLVAAVCVLAMSSAGVFADDDAKADPTTRVQQQRELRERLDKGFARLMDEAREIEAVAKPELRPVWSKPHPNLAGWGHDMAVATLDRMSASLTGNDYLDTYVRWHALVAVKKARQVDKRQMGPKLLKLLRDMPPSINVPFRPERYWDPIENYREYHRLLGNPGGGPQPPHVTIGYPPFQKTIGPPASYKYLGPEVKARYEAQKAAWDADGPRRNAEFARRREIAEAFREKNPFRLVTDHQAIEYNRRVRQMNYILRQYRGELIYALLETGDPDTAKKFFIELDRQAGLNSGAALDLLAYVYLAAFDGVMGLYDDQTLKELSRALEITARKHDRYIQWAGQTRNFADYAFHLVFLLRDGGGFFVPVNELPQTAHKP